MSYLTLFLWIAFALFFAFTNAMAFNRGNTKGYAEGYSDGLIERVMGDAPDDTN